MPQEAILSQAPRGPHRRQVLAAAGALALTSPVAATAAERPQLRIGAFTDCQYADEDDNGARLYRRAPGKLADAVAHFNRLDLAYVIHLGDFVDKDWASFDALQPVVDKLHHPWKFVLGNHDFAVADDKKALVAQRMGMPARYYSFEEKGWLFLVLDGNDLSDYGWPASSPELANSLALHHDKYPTAPDWDGGLGEAQMRWMDEALTRADRQGQKVVLYCHFPVYPLNPHDLWNAPDVIAMLERHRCVKAWINGHNHDGNYGEKAGIHYVNLKGMLDTEQTAYAVIEFYEHRIQINGFGRQPSLSLKLRA
jgi:manganese-dependent ADP-ribose/CDP-alcohol diphosphatase